MAEQTKDDLITELERSVQDTLAYFDGLGQQTKTRIGNWGAREVLAHFAYWHYATAWGIRSAALGGPPWLVPGSADEVNAAALAVQGGEGFAGMIAQLRAMQERLTRAAAEAGN